MPRELWNVNTTDGFFADAFQMDSLNSKAFQRKPIEKILVFNVKVAQTVTLP